VNPAEKILAQAPTGARGPSAIPAELPEGVEPGHCYTYGGHGRMGTCWVADDGTLSAKPRGGGLPHDWAARHAASLRWTHATLPCGCGA
jgi:hypothetical protein